MSRHSGIGATWFEAELDARYPIRPRAVFTFAVFDSIFAERVQGSMSTGKLWPSARIERKPSLLLASGCVEYAHRRCPLNAGRSCGRRSSPSNNRGREAFRSLHFDRLRSGS